MKATEMRMSCKVIAALVAVVGLAFSAFAAEYTFPNAGGDLADETAWGGTKPGDSDFAIVNKAGTYTLSSDVTFGGLRVLAGSSTFNFGNHKMTAPAGDFVNLDYIEAIPVRDFKDKDILDRLPTVVF